MSSDSLSEDKRENRAGMYLRTEAEGHIYGSTL